MRVIGDNTGEVMRMFVRPRAGAVTARADAIDEPALPAEPASELHFPELLDGRHELVGSFDAEDSVTIATALREAAGRWSISVRSISTITANSPVARSTTANGPHVNVIRDVSGRAMVAGTGTYLPLDTLSRLLCDANVHRYLRDGDSALLDYGRAQRCAPIELYQAL